MNVIERMSAWLKGSDDHPVPDLAQFPVEPPPPEPEPEVMAWEGGHIPAGKAMEVVVEVTRFAGGKPLTLAEMDKLNFPEGITSQDAIECVTHFLEEQRKAQIEKSNERKAKLLLMNAAKVVRARMKVAAPMILGKKKKKKSDRNEMSKQSRKNNRSN